MTAEVNVAEIEQQIAAAFNREAVSHQVAELIQRLDEELPKMEQTAALLRTRALSPTTVGEEASAAKSDMDEAAFSLDRMREARRELDKRMAALQDAERDARRRGNYEAAAAERDELARELAELYPQFAGPLAELMDRIRASDEKIERINTRLPGGTAPLLSAELLARGLEGFQAGVDRAPSIKTELRLPRFSYDPRAPYEWPRPGS